MRRLISQIAALFVALELVYLGVLWYRENSVYVPISAAELVQSPMAVSVRDFLKAIKDLHPSKGAGEVPPLTNYNIDMEKDFIRLGDEGTPISIELLENYLEVDGRSRDILREQHSNVVKRMPKLPSGGVGGRGIVLTGGGGYFGQALVSIRYFLDYHPGFPIELWMARSEYEPYYCENIFPSQNVTCMVVEDFFGDAIDGFDYMGYPLKSLALAGSQFAEIYFTDVDSFPLRALSELFDSKPFKKTGFISWPDYWIRVTAPEFYEITGTIPDLNKVNSSLELSDIKGCVPFPRSSETGQIVFDKKRHYNTLLLSAFYNLNGKEYYYPLLSQNNHVPGFGDKETFISAAYALGNEAYQVNSSVLTLGFFQENQGFHGSGILQLSPMDDYAKYVLEEEEQFVRPWSLHSTSMKLNPFFLFSDKDEEHWNMPNQFLRPSRWLGSRASVENRLGYDLEMRLYEVVQNVLCDWVLQSTPRFANDEDPKRTCERARNHLEWLRVNTNDHD